MKLRSEAELSSIDFIPLVGYIKYLSRTEKYFAGDLNLREESYKSTKNSFLLVLYNAGVLLPVFLGLEKILN